MLIKTLIPTLKLIDPNGIIAIEPTDVETYEDDNGDEVISNDLIKPMPEYYNCKKKIEYVIV
jgi:hypothetical protein